MWKRWRLTHMFLATRTSRATRITSELASFKPRWATLTIGPGRNAWLRCGRPRCGAGESGGTEVLLESPTEKRKSRSSVPVPLNHFASTESLMST